MSNFNPRDVSVIVGLVLPNGIPLPVPQSRDITLTGIAEADGITIEPNNEQVSLVYGTKGEFLANHAPYQAYTVTFNILASSVSNTSLVALNEFVKRNISHVNFSIAISHRLQGEKFHSNSAFLMNLPSSNMSGTIGNKVWTFMCANGVYTPLSFDNTTV